MRGTAVIPMIVPLATSPTCFPPHQMVEDHARISNSSSSSSSPGDALSPKGPSSPSPSPPHPPSSFTAFRRVRRNRSYARVVASGRMLGARWFAWMELVLSDGRSTASVSLVSGWCRVVRAYFKGP